MQPPLYTIVMILKKYWHRYCFTILKSLLRAAIKKIMNIMLIDDKRIFLTCLGRLLEINGFIITKFFSAEQAITYLYYIKSIKKSLPELIIVEYLLAELNNYQLLKEVGTISSKTNFILINGRQKHDNTSTVTQYPILDTIKRPFDFDRLLNCIKQLH